MTDISKKIVVVIFEGPTKSGLFHATSPDVPELFVSGETMDELRSAVPVVLDAILKARAEA
jgi:predicted RNase H-like HicB family nuclease